MEPVIELTPAQKHWNLVDSVLSYWEDARTRRDAVRLNEWDLPTFVNRIFPTWHTRTILRHENSAAVCVSNGTSFFLLPIYWPEGDVTAIEQINDDSYDYVDTDNWREHVLNDGFNDAVSGSDILGLAEAITSDDSGISGGGNLRPSVLLAAEAAVLTAAPEARPAMRTMLALRGIALPANYNRIVG